MPKRIFISNVLPAEARQIIPSEIEVEYNDTDQPMAKAELIRRLQARTA
jgi:hypothetical protein